MYYRTTRVSSVAFDFAKGIAHKRVCVSQSPFTETERVLRTPVSDFKGLAYLWLSQVEKVETEAHPQREIIAF